MSHIFYPTIGLEVHVELSTKSKMFCSCKNDPDCKVPNTHICSVCTAQPGSLPVPNKEAIRKVIQVGMALGGKIADFTEFDRKNYFYPDIPKGYQISQYAYPIVSGGALAGVDITRVHLEEDTGTSKHDKGDYSLVDYNRAGVPLMELVTEPVIHSAEQAGKFGRELQLLLRTLGVSYANMEKGEMRIEANISLSTDPYIFGTKVEVKNLNSFKVVEKAISYELARMQALIESGKQEEIIQETRGWDEIKQVTFSQRSKESAHDYRYFPDPDIPKYYLTRLFDFEKLQENLPELPDKKRARFSAMYGLKPDIIEQYMLEKDLADWFEGSAALLLHESSVQILSNYILSDYIGLYRSGNVLVRPSEASMASLIQMIADGELSSRGAKDTLALLVKDTCSTPRQIAELHGLIQKNDTEALRKIAEIVLEKNKKVADEYRSGKKAVIMFGRSAHERIKRKRKS
jgi:aspartyl-tRNA(Asn)/glutamyl-tRNA(Gln) amidotransferase subunit B